MPHLAAKPNPLGGWLQNMLARAHPNIVVVALAAKLARIAWAVLRKEEDFDRRALVAARSSGIAGRHEGRALARSAGGEAQTA